MEWRAQAKFERDVVVRAQLSRTELGQIIQQLGAAKPADLARMLR